MARDHRRRSILTLAACLLVANARATHAADIDWAKVASALGRPAPAPTADGVYRFGFPRSDLEVTVDGVAIKPSLALGGWLAFMPTGDGAMAMGDLVLTQDEIGPVMKRLVEGGVEIGAVHNHLLRASPSPIYMHVEGHGDPVRLASLFREAVALTKIPPPPAAGTTTMPAPLEIDSAAIDAIVGARGSVNAGVYQFSVARAEPVKEAGMVVPAAMGSAHVVNFQPTGGGKAAVTGDLVLLADEVNPALRALLANGIEVTALHSHMLKDEPRLFFMHFWANADAVALARGVREALDRTKGRRG